MPLETAPRIICTSTAVSLPSYRIYESDGYVCMLTVFELMWCAGTSKTLMANQVISET